MSRLRLLYSLGTIFCLLNSLIAFGKGGESKNISSVSVIKLKDLRCEYLDSPLGIDVRQPRLSWKMQVPTAVRGKKQTAYEILVASSSELLRRDKGDLWNSGCVVSDESVNIVYKGKSLESNQKCFWKVRICDEQGNWSAWSSPGFWRMGLFPDNWSGRWIGCELMERQSVGGQKIDNKMSDPWFRKTFDLPEKVQDAIIYVASIGYHELYVNGRKVGDAVLSPSVTDHKSRARYMTYDITQYLNSGENVIALWLGVSWSIFPAYQRAGEPAIPMALVQTEMAFLSGEKQRIVSDETWKVHASPNTLIGYWEAHHFGGEFYDASLEKPGWNTIGFDDTDWSQAKVYEPKIIVSADKTEPNRLVKEIKPLSVSEISPGTYRVDMGINYAGWFEMRFNGQPGDSVVFQFL